MENKKLAGAALQRSFADRLWWVKTDPVAELAI